MPDWLYYYLYHPFGQALALMAISIVAMIAVRARAGAIGVILTTLYVVANPVCNVALATRIGGGWWWLTFVSLGSFFVLLLVVALASSKITPKGTESGGGTAFVLPVVVYPAMLFVTGLVRLALWLIVG